MAEFLVPGVVFCDFLTVTCPADEWAELRPALEAVLDEVSCESPREGVYICPSGGWVKVGRRSGVVWIQATGGVLQALREAGAYMAYLKAIAGHSHRVTRLDASINLAVEGQKEIPRLYLVGIEGKAKLSRKAVRPSSVSAIITPSLFDGQNTGTVYFGRCTAEVRLTAYDKREHVRQKTGEDIGPLMRYEVKVSDKMGASLRDASEPTAMFWHFASPSVLEAPAGVPEWEPFRDGGFELNRPPMLPYARLKRRVESSRELARLVELADECGPKGRDLLCNLLGRYHGLHWVRETGLAVDMA